MKRALRRQARWVALVALLSGAGCAYTTVGTQLSPIQPPRPSVPPALQFTVGDFSYTLEGGKMVTSKFAGHTLAEGILNSWKDRGYIRDFQYIEDGAFSGAADCELTLSGSQYGSSSVPMQIISGLTLSLIPYSVEQSYDLQFTLRDPKTDVKYSASVRESNTTYVELFLIFALPFGVRNELEMMARMGDHLYDRLRREGAFQPSPAASP